MTPGLKKPQIPKPYPPYYAEAGDRKQFKAVMAEIVTLADQFASIYGVKVRLDPGIVVDVVRLYSRDIEKMMLLDLVAPNAYRQAAALSIWLIRLKPIVVAAFEEYATAPKERKQRGKTHINEVFALFVAFSVLHAEYIRTGEKAGMVDLIKGLDSPAYDDLLSVLRFRVVSRHAIAILLQTICEGGLKKPKQGNA